MVIDIHIIMFGKLYSAIARTTHRRRAGAAADGAQLAPQGHCETRERVTKLEDEMHKMKKMMTTMQGQLDAMNTHPVAAGRGVDIDGLIGIANGNRDTAFEDEHTDANNEAMVGGSFEVNNESMGGGSFEANDESMGGGDVNGIHGTPFSSEHTKAINESMGGGGFEVNKESMGGGDVNGIHGTPFSSEHTKANNESMGGGDVNSIHVSANGDVYSAIQSTVSTSSIPHTRLIKVEGVLMDIPQGHSPGNNSLPSANWGMTLVTRKSRSDNKHYFEKRLGLKFTSLKHAVRFEEVRSGKLASETKKEDQYLDEPDRNTSLSHIDNFPVGWYQGRWKKTLLFVAPNGLAFKHVDCASRYLARIEAIQGDEGHTEQG